jgi:hypothetical protein
VAQSLVLALSGGEGTVPQSSAFPRSPGAPLSPFESGAFSYLFFSVTSVPLETSGVNLSPLFPSLFFFLSSTAGEISPLAVN